MADDLASGFQSVDAASDFEMFANCLTLIDSLPFFAECKRESYDLLAATPGSRILEVGCGLGDDAAALAGRVAPGGSVLAIDGSQVMVDAARRRHGDVAGLAFEVADATQLPYGARVSTAAESTGCFSTLPIRPLPSVRWLGCCARAVFWSPSTTTGRR